MTFVRKFGTSVFPSFFLHRFNTIGCPFWHLMPPSTYHKFLSSQIATFSTYSHYQKHFNNNFVNFCTHTSKTAGNGKEDSNQDDFKNKKMNLLQRFKQSYAIYGKVIMVIHGLTSFLWFGSFCTIAYCGFNLLDLLDKYNAPSWMSNPLRYGGGTTNIFATAIIMYKIAAPLRYILTLSLTRFSVRYLRIKGKAPAMDDQNTLRNLARESAKLSHERLKARVAKSKRRAIAFAKRTSQKR